MNTTNHQTSTYNATDLRFKLGEILDELERESAPILIISRSKPKAWLYPYEKNIKDQDPFAIWRKNVLPRYPKNATSEFIALIRKDRDNR